MAPTENPVNTAIDWLKSAVAKNQFGTYGLEITVHAGIPVRVRKVDEKTFPVFTAGGR